MEVNIPMDSVPDNPSTSQPEPLTEPPQGPCKIINTHVTPSSNPHEKTSTPLIILNTKTNVQSSHVPFPCVNLNDVTSTSCS